MYGKSPQLRTRTFIIDFTPHYNFESDGKNPECNKPIFYSKFEMDTFETNMNMDEEWVKEGIV